MLNVLFHIKLPCKLYLIRTFFHSSVVNLGGCMCVSLCNFWSRIEWVFFSLVWKSLLLNKQVLFFIFIVITATFDHLIFLLSPYFCFLFTTFFLFFFFFPLILISACRWKIDVLFSIFSSTDLDVIYSI